MYLFIYLHDKDNIENMKNTKAGVAHREKLQLRDPNNCKTQNNTHNNVTTDISTETLVHQSATSTS